MAKTKEKKKSFNFIDVILLIVVLAIVSSLVYLVVLAYNDHFLRDPEYTDIEYTLVVKNVDNEVKYDISEGDKVTELDTLSNIGNVVSVSEKPSVYTAADSNGELHDSQHPSQKDITIVIKAEGLGSKGTYDIGSYTVSVGKSINFRVPGFTGIGNCISVEVAKSE